MKLKVMTFNIHHGKGIDGKLNLNRISKIIEDSAVDVVGINEIDRYFSNRSNYIDQVSYLAKQLHMYLAFGATYTLKPRKTSIQREFGNAILSRFPIVSEQNHLFDFYAGILEGRALLEVKLQINQQQLKIFVTHLSLNPILHRKQTDLILKKMIPNPIPKILLGDWNMKPKTTAWKKLTSNLTDVSEITDENSFYTFPSIRPHLQLDYIFVSKEFHVVSAGVVHKDPVASDHLPLTATLILN